MRLNEEQSRLAEASLGLVGKVVKDRLHDTNGAGVFTYEDLYQIGCVGLCKAAAAYTPGKAKFSTYAYILIRNEIFTALAYAALRQSREQVIESEKLPGTFDMDLPDGAWEQLNRALDATRARASGITAKGIEAIRLLSEGYTHREIGEKMGGVPANYVTAWVGRARKFLRADPVIATMRNAI